MTINLSPAYALLRTAGVTREQNGAAVLTCGAIVEAWSARRIGVMGVTALALSQSVTLRLNRAIDKAVVLAESVRTTVVTSQSMVDKDSLEWHALEAARLFAEWVILPNGDVLVHSLAHALEAFGGSEQSMRVLLEHVAKSARMKQAITGKPS